MKNTKKVLEQLESIQKGYRARLLESTDIEEAIKTLRQEREKVLSDKLGRKYLEKIEYRKSYAVPNAYKWSATTSLLSAYITKYGRIEMKIYRVWADRKPYGGEQEHTWAVYA